VKYLKVQRFIKLSCNTKPTNIMR